MSANGKIKLIFECDQEWEDMTPTACGRFCHLCKKEVYDFTMKSVDEIYRVKEENGEVCGMFLTEQVESDLIEIEVPFLRKMRYYAAAVATFVGIETAHASAKAASSPGIEMVAGIDRDHPGPGDHPTGRDSRKKKKVKLSSKKVKGGDEIPKVKRKTKIYLSKRFPFIKIRKKRRVGFRGKF